MSLIGNDPTTGRDPFDDPEQNDGTHLAHQPVTMWRILIVDDDRKYRGILRKHFERVGHQVYEAGEGETAISLAELERPEVILLDFQLPDARGSTICQRLKRHPSTATMPVAIVTAHDREAICVECFDAGADDFVLKPFSFRELLLRIRVLVEGGPWRATGVLSFAQVTVDFDTHRVRVNGAATVLSRPELALLRSLGATPHRVWTRDELLDAIWGREVHLDGRVVDGLVRRVREKLGSAAACIETVRGVGYRLEARS